MPRRLRLLAMTTENPIPAPEPVKQAEASRRAPVLLPALVEQAFDYRVPVGTPVGALVEATLAGKKRIGAVWDGQTDAALPDSKVKPVHAVIEAVPPTRASFLKLNSKPRLNKPQLSKKPCWYDCLACHTYC